MITGKDEKSLWALERLAEGWKPKDLRLHGFTESQAKKLSQFYQCEKQLETHAPGQVKKWRELGLKGLVLIPLFRQKDWEGLSEILQAVDPDIKRSELAKVPEKLYAKRERIQERKEQITSTLESLQEEKKRLMEAIRDLESEKERLKETLPMLSALDEEGLSFFLDHLGVKKGKLCLAKRLDYRWQKNLKKKGILVLDAYTHWVTDIRAMTEEYAERKKRGYRVAYDPEHGPNADFIWWEVPEAAEYEGIPSLKEIQGKRWTKLKQQVKQMEQKEQELEKELQSVQKEKVTTFTESIERSDTLSSVDLKTHGELVSLGLRWLYGQGYVVTAEFPLPGNLRADGMGYNEKGEISILECKASLQDLRRDEKWRRYLSYCDHFYFVLPEEIAEAWEVPAEAGLLVAHKTYLEKRQEGKSGQARERESIIFGIARQLSRRYTFGI